MHFLQSPKHHRWLNLVVLDKMPLSSTFTFIMPDFKFCFIGPPWVPYLIKSTPNGFHLLHGNSLINNIWNKMASNFI